MNRKPGETPSDGMPAALARTIIVSLLSLVCAKEVDADKMPIQDSKPTKDKISTPELPEFKLPEAGDKNLKLTKADILKRIKEARELSYKISEARAIYRAIKNKMPLDPAEKDNFIALALKNNLAEMPKVIQILNKETLNDADMVFLMNQLKIIVKIQRDDLVSYVELLQTLQSSLSIISFVQTSPELRTWLMNEAPTQFAVCRQLVIELDKMLK